MKASKGGKSNDRSPPGITLQKIGVTNFVVQRSCIFLPRKEFIAHITVHIHEEACKWGVLHVLVIAFKCIITTPRFKSISEALELASLVFWQRNRRKTIIWDDDVNRLLFLGPLLMLVAKFPRVVFVNDVRMYVFPLEGKQIRSWSKIAKVSIFTEMRSTIDYLNIVKIGKMFKRHLSILVVR